MVTSVVIGIVSFIFMIPFISSAWAQDTSTSWFLGSNIEPQTNYYYTICDYEYQIDVNSDPCYNVMFSFNDMLNGPYGSIWIVQVKIIHDGNSHNAILHIDPLTFETKSIYSINRKYAESIERTLFCLFTVATEYDPKILSVGRSWGEAPLHYGFESEMLVRKQLGLEPPTYQVGYSELNMIIQKGFPFPLQIDAKNHPPISSERFSVRISNEEYFNTVKNYNGTFKPTTNELKSIMIDVPINTSSNKQLLNMSTEIDPNTLHMLSLIYDTILKMVGNTSETAQLIP